MEGRDKLIGALDALDADLGEQQKRAVEYAAAVGVYREGFRRVREGVALSPASPLFEGAAESINRTRAFVLARGTDIAAYQSQVLPVLNITTSTSTATAYAVVSTSLDEGLFRQVRSVLPPLVPWERRRVEHFATTLAKLDPNLGNLARAAWEHYYAGTAEGARAALTSMRQLFDDLFRLLAPDDEVRNSTSFTQKPTEKANLVTRPERLHYAAHRYIKDDALRDVLLSDESELIKLYKELNQLHKPAGAISDAAARQTLVAMQDLLERWVVAAIS